MDGEPTSRIKFPTGARPFVGKRDLLVGEPSDQRRHLLARAALLRQLLDEHVVRQAFDSWVTRHGIRKPLERLITRLDAIAADAGLTSRTALFTSEPKLDALTRTARREAFEAFWNGVSGRNPVELVLDSYCLAVVLVAALGLSARCVPWLTLELLSWFFESLTAQMHGRAVTRQYLEVPFPEDVVVRRDPRSSAPASTQVAEPSAAPSEPLAGSKRRMPARDGRHIGSYVEQLVQHGLHHASVRKLAQAQLRGEAGVLRSEDYDGRQRVQYGLMRARAWLAGVACVPLPPPAQPGRRPATKPSTPPRPRRSTPS